MFLINPTKHLTDQLKRSVDGESKIDETFPNIIGYSCGNIRRLLNNLNSISGINYLEVGLNQGLTFCSAIYKNNINAYGIDWWKDEFSSAKDKFYKNLSGISHSSKLRIIEGDFRDSVDVIDEKIDIYFYDGSHLYQDQYDAIIYLYPKLNDKFILLIDDYANDQVQMGSKDAINKLQLKIKFEMVFPNIEPKRPWWKGLYIGILEK